jgi:type IV secretion system protein VirD4
MATFTSPDRPASFLHRLVGIKDTERPITDQEFELFERLRSNIRYAPRDIADRIDCPKSVTRRTRGAVRKLVSDPGLPGLVEVLERAKAQAIADEQRREQEKQAEEAKADERRRQEKLAALEAFHDNQLNELRFQVGQFQHLIGRTSVEEATLRIAQDSQSDWNKNQRALNLNLATQGGGRGAAVFGTLAGIENNLRDKSKARGVAAGMSRFVIRQTLVSMSDAERATLRMADVLAAVDRLTPDDHRRIAVPIVWNSGECAYDFDERSEFRERAATLEILKQLIAASLGTSAGAREYLNQAVRAALDEAQGLPREQRQIVERYLFSGNRWMSEAEGQRALARDDSSPSALRIGGFPGSSAELLYDMRESLMTIAPSGSGKSQAHVLRNLLYMKAPAVVLDIKGEMSAASRQWRERDVGKTYVFSPREPDSSFHYNPLDDISTDPEQAWEDARTVAELLFKPTAKTKDEAYFEGRARDMLTTALLDVALSQNGAKRAMKSVLELLYTSEDEKIVAWCDRLEKRNSFQLALQAEALRGMPPRQRESLLDSARRHVEIWQSPAILKVTGDTTFDAETLRSENATVYLKVTLEDVERYASVLRVLVGQSLLKLYRVEPESDAKLVTFFLDEMPRLGRLDVIEQSLDVGRGYGVRLWMFCQNLGQLQTTYPNAQGMMSNCAIRCFMNPDEDAARWLSENLGTRHGLLDGNRKPLVEAHQLTGPEFVNQVVVFSRGQLPARLDKKLAFADPICRDRVARVDEPKQETAAESPTEPQATASVSDEATDAPEEAVHNTAVNWDEVRNVTPASLLTTSAPMVRRDFGNWRFAAAGLAALVIVGIIGWLGIQVSELQTVRAEKTSLSTALDAAERDKQNFAREKASSMESLRGAEHARDKFRGEAESARKVLELEHKDHAATRERLAGAQRDMDAEKARVAARAIPPAPQAALVLAGPPQAPAAVAPQAQSAPMSQQQATSPAAAPAPQVTLVPPMPAQPPWSSTGVAPQVALQTPAPPQAQSVPPQQQQPTDCDLLAANPSDQRRVGIGVKYPELKRNAAAAIEACDRALVASPNEQRFLYQKARALYAAHDERGNGHAHRGTSWWHPYLCRRSGHHREQSSPWHS